VLIASCGVVKKGPSIPANELGRVFVVEYHRIGDKNGNWIRGRDSFKKDLETFYKMGFRLVSIKDFFNSGLTKVPEGKKPLILTFDDGHPTQFRFLIMNGTTVEGEGGLPKVDPDCAVGILDEFSKKHPDFGRSATFFVNGQMFYQKECPSLWKMKLQYLKKTGREIGNHTFGHEILSKLSYNEIKKTLALLQAKIEEALPSYEASSVALPDGILPKKGRWLLQDGSWAGKEYHYKISLLVGWSPTHPMYHRDFDPAMVQRIQADDAELPKWFSYMEKHPGEIFVSDGDPMTITIQAKDRDKLDISALNENMKVRICEGTKVTGEIKALKKKDSIIKNKAADKGVYYTFHSAGLDSKIDHLIEKYRTSGLDTVVIDLKDIEGTVGCRVDVPLAQKIGACDRVYIQNFSGLIEKLHKAGIRVSVRIAVFKDRLLAKKRPDLALKGPGGRAWTENDGINWVNPFHPEVCDYNIDLAEFAIKAGADEVQFDYIRFPEKGRVENISIPKDKEKFYAIEGFLKKAYERLHKYDASIAIDVFGVMSWLKDADIAITGQRVEYMAKYVHNVCPMLYPSHFDKGFDGYKSPVNEPYLFIKRGCEKTAVLLKGSGAKMTPWIQGFDWRVKDFNEDYVLKQLKAVKDCGISGFLVWNAGNKYSVTYSALSQ